MSADTSSQPGSRISAVRDRIARASARVDRDPGSVVIIAVGKTHPPDAIQEIVDHGIADVAENRVQELTAKMGRVEGARWHLVGHLQRNKAKHVVGRQVLVHSLDRRSLADDLERRAAGLDRIQRVLVQANVGDDPAKGGCDPDETLDLVAYARALPHLSVEGLMTIPPLPQPDEDAAEAARPHFRRLRVLRDEARARWPEVVHLSMGMSADLESAVEEGATMVRIGTALFGSRHPRPWQPAGGVR